MYKSLRHSLHSGGPCLTFTPSSMLNHLPKCVRRLVTATIEPTSSWLPEPIRLTIEPLKFQLLSRSNIPELFLSRARHLNITDYLAAASVFPMRANNYVVNDLINWTNVPQDPMFKLTFPQPDMLSECDLNSMRTALSDGSSKVAHREIA